MIVRRELGRWSCAAAWLALAGVAGVPVLAADCPNPIPPTIRDLPDPPELQSVGGMLRGTLRIAPAEGSSDSKIARSREFGSSSSVIGSSRTARTRSV